MIRFQDTSATAVADVTDKFMVLHKLVHFSMQPGTETQAVPVFTSGSATGKKKKVACVPIE